MTPEEFYSLRLIYFFEKMEGYFDKVTEDRKFSAFLIRRATTILYNTQIVEKSDAKEVYQLWPLPWDDNYKEEEDETPVEEIRKQNSMLVSAVKNFTHER